MKKILLASFIFPERIEWFIKYLDEKFEIPKEKVFLYKNIDDTKKIIATFKLTIQPHEQINLKKIFPSAIPIHKKGDSLYTINALNRIIDDLNIDTKGNISNKDFKLDWENYQNKIMLIRDNELTFFNIERILS